MPGIQSRVWQRLLWGSYSLRHACLGCLILGMIRWSGPLRPPGKPTDVQIGRDI